MMVHGELFHVEALRALSHGGQSHWNSGGDCDGAATMLSHLIETSMNRITHLPARSASGAAWLSARGFVGGMAKRSAGQPAAQI